MDLRLSSTCWTYFSPYFADGGSRTSLAERCRRPEFWLHVQTVGDWQFKCWQNILPVSVRRWLVHFSLCLYRWNRLQSQNRLPTRQTRQATNLGKLNLTFLCRIHVSNAKDIEVKILDEYTTTFINCNWLNHKQTLL